ncbi:hypothetical protein MSPP1_001657 [Malassezia sp. CBS 17886]|nr:hypothetical protein MSPP1_001657 [Malassezia sp. CBS 17886]
MYSALWARGADGADSVLQDVSDHISERTSLSAVLIFIAIFLGLGMATLAGFLVLRPRNKTVYAPKCKYNVYDGVPPELVPSYRHWMSAMRHRTDARLAAVIGTDAVVFLVFARLMRWTLTVVAVLACVVLVPIDLSYNLSHAAPAASKRDAGAAPAPSAPPSAARPSDAGAERADLLNYVTMAQLRGPELWAHVTLSYVATLIALAFIFVTYRRVIALRQAFFSSAAYQRSYYSRALMITDIAEPLRSDAALREALSHSPIAYPLSEVQIGRSMGNLPALLDEQRSLVCKLERCLNTVLQKRHARRPLVRDGAHKVDAIDQYAAALRAVETEITHVRANHSVGAPQSYGFASLAAVSYAHTAAKAISRRRVRGMRIHLAPSPRDIIWSNVTKRKGERRRLRALGFIYFVLLFAANILPMLIAAAISNMGAFTGALPFLGHWQGASSLSFAAVAGLFPPLVTMAAALVLPILMRRIAMYRGVRTRESRDLALSTQYFTFLVLTQFVIFSLLSVVLDVVVNILHGVHRAESAGAIVARLGSVALQRIAYRFQSQSGYWMSWIALKGFMMLFELAQVTRLVFVWLHKHVSRRTPRELFEFAKPPTFAFWIAYAELMFLAAIALIYAPLAPLVSAFAAAVFWIASLVYKNQFLYVYTTKSETGGRLWAVVVDQLLVTIAFMPLIIAIVVGLKQSWVKAVACVPPVLFVAAFKVYCRVKLEPAFLWYTPTPMELARSKVHLHDADRQRLDEQFGHPFLHDPLYVPIVYPSLVDRAAELYDGPLVSSQGHKTRAAPSASALDLHAAISMSDLKQDVDAGDADTDTLPLEPSHGVRQSLFGLLGASHGYTEADDEADVDGYVFPPPQMRAAPARMDTAQSSVYEGAPATTHLRQGTFDFPPAASPAPQAPAGARFASPCLQASPDAMDGDPMDEGEKPETLSSVSVEQVYTEYASLPPDYATCSRLSMQSCEMEEDLITTYEDSVPVGRAAFPTATTEKRDGPRGPRAPTRPGG